MIDNIIRTFKGILPPSTWDLIFGQFKVHEVKFKNPSYPAVRVSKDYLLVKVPSKTKQISENLSSEEEPLEMFEDILNQIRSYRRKGRHNDQNQF